MYTYYMVESVWHVVYAYSPNITGPTLLEELISGSKLQIWPGHNYPGPSSRAPSMCNLERQACEGTTDPWRF